MPANLLNFRGGDVFAIAAELERAGVPLDKFAEAEPDGGAGAWTTDPDGNRIYFSTGPGESPEMSCLTGAYSAL